MEVRILPDPQAVAHYAAQLFVRHLQKTPQTVLGLATGSTPIAMYRELIAQHRAGHISFAEVSSFNLDEYVGLAGDHPQSYRSFMNEQLFNHVDIDTDRTYVPDGSSAHPDEVGPAYEAAIVEAGGIDLQLLGLGGDGHIGFNEQTSSLASRTRVKTLTQRTISDNARFFGPDEIQPDLAITMGIGTILDSRRVVLLACGSSKAQAVAQMVEGAVTSMCPASALQMHQRATVVVDAEAAGSLQLGSYYQWVAEQQDALVTRLQRDSQ